jgi:Fe-S cluster biogenesis protein NfuA
MPDAKETRDLKARLERLDGLLQEMGHLADPSVQARIREIVQTILELHAAGLERLLGHVSRAGAAGNRVLEACKQDEVVSNLLVLHDLHPQPLDERVRQALDDVRPYLRTHGGSVELLDIDGTSVRLKLDGNCHGCPSSAMTMKQTIEEAILTKAPEVTGIEVEGMVENPRAEEQGRLALPVV